MKVKFTNLFFMASISILFVGCVRDALPMTKQEVLEITKGDSFEPQYYAYFDRVKYTCDRLDPESKEIMKTIWTTGTYKNYELYNYMKADKYSAKKMEVKAVGDSFVTFYVYEKRDDCVRFAGFVGSSTPTVNVNVR